MQIRPVPSDEEAAAIVAAVEAAWPKPILFFPARHDHWLVQTGDGYAAHIAGAIGVSTDAQASWWGSRGMGTVPHALIACYKGDTVAASEAFAQCQVKKVFEAVCLRDPVGQTDRDQIAAMTSTFRGGNYNLRNVFAESAVYCMGP